MLAQAIPAECVDDAVTVTCIVAPPATINDELDLIRDDGVVVIGDGANATSFDTLGDAVTLTGAGSQTVTVSNGGSTIAGDVGIHVQSTGGNGDITITNSGTVNGVDDAINANHGGNGQLTVTSNRAESDTAESFSLSHAGVGNIVLNSNASELDTNSGLVANHSGTGNIEATFAGSLSVAETGISATSSGTGDVNVTVNGEITGGELGANLAATTGNIVFSSGAIDATDSGIIAQTITGGNIDVDVGGSVAVRDFGIGINTVANSGTTSVNVTGNVTGALDGVNSFSNGSQAMDITVGGTINSVFGSGVIVSNDGGNVTVETGNIQSGGAGVNITSAGLSQTHVTTGDITSAGSDGIRVTKSILAIMPPEVPVPDDNEVVINAGNINADDHGISVTHEFTGVVSATAGTIESGLIGMRLRRTNTGAISASAASVDAGQTGFEIQQLGGGDATVSVTGAVTSAASHGLFLNNQGNGAIDVDLGSIDAGMRGIELFRLGTGLIDVDVANGIESGNDGISVQTIGSGNVDISVGGAINAGGNGIVSVQQADGDLNITAAGPITADAGGVVVNRVGIGDGTITLQGDVQAEDAAIDLSFLDDGEVTVDVDGAVTSNTAEGLAFVHNGDGNSVIDIAGPVTAGGEAVTVINNGDGDFELVVHSAMLAGDDAIDISKNGDGAITLVTEGLESATETGIRLSHNGAIGGTDIHVRQGITAAANGIDIFTAADGNSSVQVDGAIHVEEDAISAMMVGDGALNINANGPLTAGEDGLSISRDGVGTTIVRVLQDVTAGGSGVGISRFGGAGNIDLETSGTITATSRAININQSAAGDVRVVSHGDVSSTTDSGVHLFHTGIGSISGRFDGAIEAARSGIEVFFSNDVDGAGNLDLTFNGDVTAGERGVSIVHDIVAGDMTVTVNGTISATETALHAIMEGDGTAAMTSTGALHSETENGILFIHDGTGDSVIVANSVSGTRGIEASADNGELAIRLMSGALVRGRDGAGISGINSNDSDYLISGPGASVLGSEAGIDLELDTGAARIGNLASVIGTTEAGVDIISQGGSVDLFTIGTVRGATDGLVLRSGGGLITVSGNGLVGGILGVAGSGMVADARNFFGGGGDIEIGTGALNGVIAGDVDGIQARTQGTGVIAVATSANVTGGENAMRFSADAAGSIDVTINSGVVTGGAGAGISFDESTATSRLDNIGGTISASSGLAVSGADGNEHVSNGGTITGNVDLGAGSNSLLNRFGGTINAGTLIDVGAGNAFTNAGTFSIGTGSGIATTAITGTFTQQDSGILVHDVDTANGRADRINVTGAATLDGGVRLNFTGFSTTVQRMTLLSASLGAHDAGLALTSLSPVVLASLEFVNNTDVVLNYQGVDFTPTGVNLNRNQRAIGEALNSAFIAGSSAMDPVFDGLLNSVSTGQGLAEAYDQLSPELQLAGLAATSGGAGAFSSALFSCPDPNDAHALVAQENCLWMRPSAGATHFDTTAETIGFDSRFAGLSVGGQVELRDGWTLGGAFSHDQAWTTMATGANSAVETYNLGGVVKYQSGPMVLAANVTGGMADLRSNRRVAFGTQTLSVASDSTIYHGGIQLHGAVEMRHGASYFMPSIDVSAMMFQMPGYAETGSPAAALTVASAHWQTWSVTPAIEIGHDVTNADGTTVRLMAKAGLAIGDSTEQALTARFAGGNAFRIARSSDPMALEIGAGLKVMGQGKTRVDLGYQGRIARTSQQHSAFAKLAVNF